MRVTVGGRRTAIPQISRHPYTVIAMLYLFIVGWAINYYSLLYYSLVYYSLLRHKAATS